MKNAMTVQKELFVQGLLAGKSKTEAYLFAYPEEKKKNKRTTQNKASLLAKRPEVVARLEELRAGVQQDTAVTLNQFILDLQKLALADVNPLALRPSDKLRAMELLAKVMGFSAASTESGNGGLTTFEMMVKELYERPDEEAEAVSD